MLLYRNGVSIKDVQVRETFDVMILGAGASGLMCAGWLQQHSALKVGVIEGNSKAAAKLKVSGGGKCNITNVDVRTKHFLGDSLMVDSVLRQFSKEELLGFLRRNGLQPVIRKERYYFCPKSSDEIISILKYQSNKADFFYTQKILGVTKSDGLFIIKTDKTVHRARNVVVATGGVSFSVLGATDIGLNIAEAFGHAVKPFSPALVGLTLQPDQFWMKALSGISLPVRIIAGERVIDEDLLFAHKGISGPAVLSASLYWHKGSITIDFLPSKNIIKQCKREKKQISTVMNLPKRFSKAFLEHLGITDQPCSKLSSDESDRLGQLHHYRFAPSGTFGFSKAEVSRGGVKTEKIDPHTMQSKKVEGLYFIGEVVDVTGELGGYNFQWAFGSGVVAADGIIRR